VAALCRSTLAAGLVAVCLLAGSVAKAPGAATACGSSGYAYAGLAGTGAAYGLTARLTALSAPEVLSGHVAGWIGVGGVGEGPKGTNEWIQVGFSGFPGSPANDLYYEVAQPNQSPVYHEIASNLAPGTTKKVTVLEIAGRRGWWRVWVDHQPVGDPVYLPGSHGAWHPIATAEAWGAGSFVCNHFRYQFHAVRVATAAGGGWFPLRHLYTFQDHGYYIRRVLANTYVAASS
jgi:hypothetical protein